MSAKLQILTIASACIAIHCAGCGYAESGLGPPEAGVTPVAPLHFEFNNHSSSELFVDWSNGHAHFTLERNDTPLLIDPACVPECSVGCACDSCPPQAPMALRVPPGGSLVFTWNATVFENSSCDASATCSCVERWPATSGNYLARVVAYAAALGGSPAADNPNLIVGGAVDPSSPRCSGSAQFPLAGSATVQAPFICEP